jgi:hypothetical protein
LILLVQLLRTARQVHPDPSGWEWLARIKYCLRALLTQRLTREWFRILGEPKLAVLVRNHPHIFSKLQRSYLDNTPGPWSRLRALKSHYRFVILRLSDESLRQIYSDEGLVLTRILLHEAGSIELRLGYHDSLSKEGEMAVSIYDGDTGNMLVALSFCICEYDARKRQIFVGGLQSFNNPECKGRVVEITRALHGLRPKGLLFFTLQQFVAVWRLGSIRAVSNSRHVYQHYRKRRKVPMSYDEFWFECGGQLGPDGLFTLPTLPTPRDLSKMKPSKRQMYRHRYLLLHDVASQIQDAVARYTLPEKLSFGAPPQKTSTRGTRAWRLARVGLTKGWFRIGHGPGRP